MRQQDFYIEITEGVRFEFDTFRLEEHREFIEVQGQRIYWDDITILDWLIWAYPEECKDLGILITQEDLEETYYEEFF